MELLLVRHAESLWNANRGDNLDSDLTERGMKQCIDVASYLKKEFPNLKEWKGIVSPFLRTLKTAQKIHEYTDVNFDIDSRVSEYGGDYPGIFEVHVPSRKNDFPFKVNEIGEIGWDLAWSGNVGWTFGRETEPIFLDRMCNFLKKLKDDRYIVVSHGHVIHTIADIYNGIYEVTKWDRSVLNTSVTWIVDGKIKYFAKFVNDGEDPRCKYKR